MSDAFATLVDLTADRLFLYALGISIVCVVVGLVSRFSGGWIGAIALLAGTGGSTFLLGQFAELPLAASAGLALVTGVLGRPVISEVLTAVGTFIVSDAVWRPGLGWPVLASSLVSTLAVWGPKRFGRADPRAVAIVAGGAVFAVWASVPDTEVARALLGATLAVALAAVIGERPVFTGPAVGALVGLSAWATMIGGSPRVVSVFGAWSGLALMTVLGTKRFENAPVGAWLVAQLVVVGAGSQIVARAGSGQAAAGILFIAIAVAGAILAVAADRGIAPQRASS